MNWLHRNTISSPSSGCPHVKNHDIGLVMRELSQCMLHDNIRVWKTTAKKIAWDKIPTTLLRTIALKVYNHQHGHVFIEAILPCHALLITDIEIISWHWNNLHPKLVEILVQKLYEIGEYLDSPQDEIETIIENLKKERSPIDSFEFE